MPSKGLELVGPETSHVKVKDDARRLKIKNKPGFCHSYLRVREYLAVGTRELARLPEILYALYSFTASASSYR